MPHQYAQRMFTPAVKQLQSQHGSRDSYRSMDEGADYNGLLSQVEAQFIAARDSFYMASVSATGWPYVQHRGGPIGFIKVLDEKTIGFADYSGNRQYISAGNFLTDNRVSLILMDYPNKTRLKVLGRVQIISDDNPSLLAQLEDDHYRARVERGVLIHIEAFDWNCPQHIQSRFTQAEVDELMQPLQEQLQQANKAGAVDETFGDGPIPLTVIGIKQLSSQVKAYELQRQDGQPMPAIESGAHIKLPVATTSGALIERKYSIVSHYPIRNSIEVAIQREDQGQGGSIAIHQRYAIGTQLKAQAPDNYFPLSRKIAPVVLIAGGIGITAIKSMANTLMEEQRLLGLHYAGRHREDMPYLDELKSQLGNHLYSYPANKRKLNLKRVLAKAPATCLFYICGPGRLISEAVETAAQLGIEPDRIRIEKFTANNKNHDTNNNKPFTAELSKSKKRITVGKNETLLDAIIAADISIPSGCKNGTCRACVVEVLEGTVDHRDSALSNQERSEQNLMCPCVSRAKTPNLTIKA